MLDACAGFRLGEWLVEPRLGRISGTGGAVHLRPLLMDLLVLLERNRGRPVSKEEIRAAIWGRRFLAASALTRLIAELRSVLGDDVESPRFIETVPKRGYRLVPPVSPAGPGAGEPARRLSIAVLPFADMTRERDQEYLCDGLAEELTNSLTCLGRLRVIARTSAFAFKGRAVDIREIGRALGVDTIVEGGIQRAADRLRVTVQLIDAATGGHLWSDHFDRCAGDIFAIEDEIAQAVVRGLKMNLLGEGEGRISRKHSRNPGAHDLYLWGRFLWGKRTPGAVAQAIQSLEQAVDMDAEYALAWAALSECYCTCAFLGFLAPQDAYPKAQRAARRALDLDPSLPEAHAVLAFAAATYDWEWLEAERGFLRAEAAGPSYAQARVWHSQVLAFVGRFEEAIAQIERAWDLDPLSPLVQATVANILILARRYEEAIERCRKTLEMDPDFVLAHFHLGRASMCAGRPADALPAFEKAAPGFPIAMGLLGGAWAIVGRRDKAEEILRRLESLSHQRYVGALPFVVLYAGPGDEEARLAYLTKVFDDHEGLAAIFNVDPSVDSLRPDPRFQALLARLRIPRGT